LEGGGGYRNTGAIQGPGGAGGSGIVIVRYLTPGGKDGLISTTPGETPFWTNASYNPWNISLGINESRQIVFWVNATGDVGTNHTFFVFANKTSDMGISNITIKWNVTIYENQPPTNPSPTLVSTDGSNSSLADLNCSAQISDAESEKINVTIMWYNNSVLDSRLDYNSSYASGTLFEAPLNLSNLTSGDTWICSMRLYDGGSYSNWVNSSSLSIIFPSIDLDLISPTGNMNATQNQLFNVTLNITCRSGNCGIINVTLDPDNWWNTSFGRRKEINITGVGSLTDFPAYLNITKDSFMQADYDDIRFVNGACSASGGGQLAHEIENWTAVSAHVWVKIPSISSGDNSICIYYNNSDLSSGENVTDVWDANYIMVQHLQENSGSLNDSTEYGNNGDPQGGLTQGYAGKIDGAVDFDGKDDYGNISDSASFDITEGFTIGFWMKPAVTFDSSTTVSQTLVSKYEDAEDQMVFILQGTDNSKSPNGGMYVKIESEVPRVWHYAFSSQTTWTAGTWYYIIGMYEDSTYATLYVNAVNNTGTTEHESTAFDLEDTEVNLLLGRGIVEQAAAITGYFNGTIDEVRISNINRSNDWINQSYQMMAAPATYATFGGSENSSTSKGIISTVEGTTPFWTNASYNPWNISLNKDQSRQIVFMVNATGTVGTNHTFFAYANLTSNLSVGNITAKWNVSILAFVNTAPENPTPSIVSIGNTYTNHTELNCSSSISDFDTDKLNVTVRWYNNSILDSRLDYNNSYTSGETFSATLDTSNLTAGDTWGCSMRVHDGTDYSDWVNSTTGILINLCNYTRSADWTITEDEICQNLNITISGTVDVLSGGNLTFNNVTFNHDLSSNNEFYFYVRAGGKMIIANNSFFQEYTDSYRVYFRNYGNTNITGSTFDLVGDDYRFYNYNVGVAYIENSTMYDLRNDGGDMFMNDSYTQQGYFYNDVNDHAVINNSHFQYLYYYNTGNSGKISLENIKEPYVRNTGNNFTMNIRPTNINNDLNFTNVGFDNFGIYTNGGNTNITNCSFYVMYGNNNAEIYAVDSAIERWYSYGTAGGHDINIINSSITNRAFL